MSIDLRDRPPPRQSPALPVTRSDGPVALTDAELDHVTAGGSKPGMVGDGLRPQQFTAMD
jgi:hypothetical protein